MKQLCQKLKNGAMEIIEVPPPVLGRDVVLVRNYCSLISAGTEGGTVTAARKSLLGKAKERPQQVKQVLDVLRQQGPVQTCRAVMKKLDAWSPLGYSSAGRIIEVGSHVAEFAVGDLVACGGLTANHSEIVAVPVNLCVKLHKDADPKLAAYNTLGAIALQGVRQADLRLGETCAVIGLGLIGRLASLLLSSGGIRVVGIDIDQNAVLSASGHGVDLALLRREDGIEEKINAFTDGLGVDAVIITAGANSLDPVNFAGTICRKRGRVVVVGNVPTGFDRDPHYYRKELELRMSCSYGPGRYDPLYEEKGVDYPAAYVRWTEKRNMEAFQQMVHSGGISLDGLTTHVFKLAQAPEAYDLILQKSEPHLGILIEYEGADRTAGKVTLKKHSVDTLVKDSKIGIAFIGAGSYAQSHLLPNIPHSKDVKLKGVMTSSGTTSRSVAERFGFEFCTSDYADIFGKGGRTAGIEEASIGINTVFIATRHDSHGCYVSKALKAGKHVFVEKPLCLNENDLNEITDFYSGAELRPLLMVGFNRRFAPLAEIVKGKMGSGPMSMIYRVNAGSIPVDSWIQDPELGGGRIIGEVCHFVDFMTFLNGSRPATVSAQEMEAPHHLHDNVQINLTFENGSIGTISYLANGAKSLAKEYIEVYANGVTALIRDFKELEVFGPGSPFRKKLFTQDKGQAHMVKAFIEAVRNGGPPPIAFEDIHAVTLTTFRIIESLRTGSTVRL
ncbi:MAG: bi-domain-containing oxidoreductase [Smithellaceae bacterium]|nr:bi-domain-containing oxidoreductase [Smithellaceae bacterium]